jgi:hypothetical protein
MSSSAAKAKVVPFFDLDRDFHTAAIPTQGELFFWNENYQLGARRGSTLFIPAGTHDSRGPDNTGFRAALSKYGPGRMTVLGAGQGVTIVNQLSNAFGPANQPGQDGSGNGAQPNINALTVGATTATCKSIPDSYQFRVGDWVMLCAYDMQSFGHPRNNHYFEFRKITAMNYDTGTATFDEGVDYNYSDTYPELQPGTAFLEDQGGPATMIKMSRKNWDIDLIVKNLTIDNASAFFGGARTLLWENCTFEDWSCIPSLCKNWRALNCTFNGNRGLEFDKSVETVTYENCTIWDPITQQSSSINDLYIINSYVDHLNGTPKRATLTDTDFDFLRLGPSAYGAGYSVVIDNCDVATTLSYVNRSVALSKFASTTGGVLTITFDAATPADSDCLLNLIPDPNCWYRFGSAEGFCGPSFQITDVTFDSGTDLFTYTTTLDGTEPQWAIATTIQNHDCPDLTVTDSTGKIAFCSYAAAAGLALGEYFNSGTLSNCFQSTSPFVSSSARSIQAGILCGDVVSIKVNVTKAYTGTAATMRVTLFGDSFSISSARFVDDTGAAILTGYQPGFDLKTTGERVITLSGVTGSGGADTGLSLGTRVWMCSNRGIRYALTANISGESSSVWPEWSVEIILDQGIS